MVDVAWTGCDPDASRTASIDGPIAQLRLERTPDKREVGGSSPPRPTICPAAQARMHDLCCAEKAAHCGGVAQLGEHLLCTQEVIGSIPFTSTTFCYGSWSVEESEQTMHHHKNDGSSLTIEYGLN